MIDTPLNLINMGDVIATPVDWLWYPYIPYGKVTIIQGDPGEGKTTLALNIAATLTCGGMLPGDTEPREPINVIYQTAEDGLADTVKPRLEAANADCTRVLVIDESKTELSLRDERIEEAIAKTNAKLVILDPLQAYLGADVDMHRANEIRPVMSHLGRIAEEYGCAIVLIGHMNKATGQKCAYRGLGSIDIFAASRSTLLVGKVKNDKYKRIMAHVKSSLAPIGSSLVFEIREHSKIEWNGTAELTADQFLEDGGERIQKIESAKKFLLSILSDGGKRQKDIVSSAKGMDFGIRTLHSAKAELGIKSIKTDNGWSWILPKSHYDSLEECKDATNTN